MIPYNTLIVLSGVGLLGACAGLVGTFAVLRRRALTGDALAHAALPGVCLAFLVVGGKNLSAMLLGAFLTGVLGVVIISALRRWTRIKEDAAIGIVLGVFFGAGIALSRIIQQQATGSKAGLDSFIYGKTSGMLAQDVYLIGGLALLCLALILLLYKEFKVVAFDPAFARTQGWPAFWLDLLLMSLLAVAVVVALPAVGVIMIAALLILPAATARFWTDRLSWLLGLSALLGAGAGLTGAWLSSRSEQLPAGPVIVLCGTSAFVLSALLAPRRGILGRLLVRRRLRWQLDDQTLLRILFDLTELELPDRPVLDVETLLKRRSWSPAELQRLLQRAEQAGYVNGVAPGKYVLTERGLAAAAAVARDHRLWQLFLTDYPDLATGLLTFSGTSPETILPAASVEELRSKLQQAGRWPAGLPAQARVPDSRIEGVPS